MALRPAPPTSFGQTIALAIVVLLLPARAALGLALIVNSTADEPAADPTIVTCISTPSGKCTLRAAIMIADFYAGPHTITLPAGTFTLTRPGYDDGALVGDLDIAHDLTIQGAGSAETIVDGNGAVTGDRVFHVLSTAQNVTLQGLTIKNGHLLPPPPPEPPPAGVTFAGGGLYIEGSGQLHLFDVIVEGNTTQDGGGIYANFTPSGGVITMDHVIVRNNTAMAAGTGVGGGTGIYAPSNASVAVIQDSQVYGNTADGTGGGLYVSGYHGLIQRSEIYSNTASYAGGIFNASSLTLSDSRVHDNHASMDGGALMAVAPYILLRTTLAANSAGRLGGAILDQEASTYAAYIDFAQIETSTLSGNGAQHGGAIYHDASAVPTSPLFLLNSTISGNTASGGPVSSGGPNGGGGGIFINGGKALLLNATVASNHVLLHGGPGGGLYIMSGANFTARNSLIANNWLTGTAVTGNIPDDGYTNGTITGELVFDLIRTTTNFFIIGPQPGTIVGQDPLLGPLQGNGGPTQTHALLPGSPATNAGETGGCIADAAGTALTVDQRGAPRPYPTGTPCDIGAFELSPIALDIDVSAPGSKYDPLTDGVLVIRYLLKLTGSSLTNGALGGTATRIDPTAIEAYLDGIATLLDVDGDGALDVHTDGLLILRYLFGLTGDALIAGAVGPNAMRKTAADIQAYIQSLMP